MEFRSHATSSQRHKSDPLEQLQRELLEDLAQDVKTNGKYGQRAIAEQQLHRPLRELLQQFLSMLLFDLQNKYRE